MDRKDVKVVSSTQIMEIDAVAATGRRSRTGRKRRRWRSGAKNDSLGLWRELIPDSLLSRREAIPLIAGETRIRWLRGRPRWTPRMTSSCMNV